MDDELPAYLLYAGAYDLPVGDYDGVITVNDELLAQRQKPVFLAGPAPAGDSAPADKQPESIN